MIGNPVTSMQSLNHVDLDIISLLSTPINYRAAETLLQIKGHTTGWSFHANVNPKRSIWTI